MPQYAKNTAVSVGKSKIEIEKTLYRYGASKFAYGSSVRKAMIGFKIKDRTIRITLNIPGREDFRLTGTGRERADNVIGKEWEQGCRQRWRALALVIKAKLEAIDSGIATLEDEFLAYTVLPSGSTIGQKLSGQLNKFIETGKSPLLLTGSEIEVI